MMQHAPIALRAARWTCLGMLLGTLGTAVSYGQALKDLEVSAEAIGKRLAPLVKAHDGNVGIAVRFLGHENQVLAEWAYQGNVAMPTASLIKLPVMMETYRQAEQEGLDLHQMIELTSKDKVPGSGILTGSFSDGTRLALVDAVRLMIRFSDNTATNLVLDQIGLESTRATMTRLGFPETQIHAKVYRRDTSIDLARSEAYGLGSTTAWDMVELLTLLARGTFLGQQACDAMLEHLLACEDDSKLAAGLPAGTKFAHKTGAVTRVRTDAGILERDGLRCLVCVLTNENADTRWSDENAANRLCAEVGKTLWELMEPRTGAEPGTTQADAQQMVMAVGAQGVEVEDLQRTLNRRIAAGLSVDGSFGPATEAAVETFQRKYGLRVDGRMDRASWTALGPLLTEDEPVPAPEVVNASRLPVEPPLDLDAPPETTAKAWAIWDVDKSLLLADKQGASPLANASTTKLMTALLVAELAAAHPELLEEMVVFSKRADETIGSTSGVRAGEQLTAGELLYGLLLPSGNDAAVALAEHFGSRAYYGAEAEGPTAGGPESGQSEDAYEVFVRAMNRRAAELGMLQTHFENPHGLTAEDHRSSAADLGRLALRCWQIPLLREIVSTRQRGCQVERPDGRRRNLLWKNTNRLLAQEGFMGLKTGTTSAAGACLVALGTHQGKTRVVVVLGSTNSSARYVDARNLFRWTWREAP